MPMMMYNGRTYGKGIGGGGNAAVELTKAEYDALVAAGQVKADTLYLIKDGLLGTDAGMGNTDISKIGDGTVTGAINEINSSLEELEESSLIPKRVLTSADDLNTLYEPGIYSFATNNVPQNSPFSNGSIVEVIYATNARIIQRVTRYGVAGQSAERVLFGTDWLAWVMRCTPVRLYKAMGFTGTTTNYELITTVTIPGKSFYVLGANLGYGNSKPTGVRICYRNEYQATSCWQEQDVAHDAYEVSCVTTGYTEAETTFYIFGKWHAAAKNSAYVRGFYIPT